MSNLDYDEERPRRNARCSGRVSNGRWKKAELVAAFNQLTADVLNEMVDLDDGPADAEEDRGADG